MDIKQKLKLIEDNNKKIDAKLQSNYKNNQNTWRATYEDSNNICILNQKLIKEIEAAMATLDNSAKYEFNSDLKIKKEECSIKQRNVDKMKQNMESNENLNKLKAGDSQGLTKQQINEATKGAAIDLNMRTDMNQELIGEIGKNLYTANDNLKFVSVEVNKQGTQIDKISGDVADTGKIVGRTGKRIDSMNRRTCCHKCLLHVLIVLLAVSCVVVLIVKLTRK